MMSKKQKGISCIDTAIFLIVFILALYYLITYLISLYSTVPNFMGYNYPERAVYGFYFFTIYLPMSVIVAAIKIIWGLFYYVYEPGFTRYHNSNLALFIILWVAVFFVLRYYYKRHFDKSEYGIIMSIANYIKRNNLQKRIWITLGILFAPLIVLWLYDLFGAIKGWLLS